MVEEGVLLMMQEGRAKLLQAYRAAIEAGQDGIADMLGDVILEEMNDRPSPKVFREDRSTTSPPWTITCGTDAVPFDAKRTCTGIDHPSREVTS